MAVLAIDIGNTTIAFGVFSAKGARLPDGQGSAHIKHFGGGRSKKLVLNFKLLTHNKGRDFYRKSILRALGKNDIAKIIICSVVPKKTPILKGLLKEIFNKKVLEVGKDIKIPIRNLYKNPKQVGQDRLVNAYAGLKFYGAGLILVDFGTAITFDVVSKKGEYLGGLILPGIDISLDALHKRTALLPRVKIKRPFGLVGQDTENSINNGVVYSIAGACDSIIARLLKRYKGYKIITIGGNANFIRQYSSKIKIVRLNLTLEGLSLLAYP